MKIAKQREEKCILARNFGVKKWSKKFSYGTYREFDVKVGDFVRYEDDDFLVFRCHEDRKTPMKKVHAWSLSFRKQKNQLADPFARNLQQDPKGIEAAKIQAQQNLISANYGGREDFNT